MHADERLRRIGREYIFQTDVTDPPFCDYNGTLCTVLGVTPVAQNEPLTGGLMWKVQFQDGKVLDAWDFELCYTKELMQDLKENPGQVRPIAGNMLDRRITDAHMRTDNTSVKIKNSPEPQI